ncbi:bone morphogenetic protein receptor type-2-like [Thalassophryne amazonica]|uniref:bone morphogenetic protein receptor type-2-like n=1 Tax=Thalassophryne amazonica TaxID=390379 RepID=UPI001471456A|nr:bone morphogenetic protein receptor type-2-like [Thalassophryne amazonica]
MMKSLLALIGCTFMFISSQSLHPKRRCVFQANPKHSYRKAGNVTGSVEHCERTHCCVGYYLLINGQPEVKLQACSPIETSCPDATCKAILSLNNNVLKCMCNIDLCNHNITWEPELEQPQGAASHSKEYLKVAAVVFVTGAICFALVVAIWIHIKETKENQPKSVQDDSLTPPKTSEIECAAVALQQIVGCGHFATVWQGKYQGSVVAVKVFPVGCKQNFILEKEVYELPLMKHTGIVHFLGSGRKVDSGDCFLVLELAEYGSLHSFLCNHASNWMLSLKLCQSLSQGLSYLHTDLLRNGAHKPPVAHRDLSSSNVLVKADSTCVLSDFGCSSVLSSYRDRPRWQSNTTVRQLGTLHYMAPEILEGAINLSCDGSLLQADVYSLGLLLWEIVTRCSDLFEGDVPEHRLPYEFELGAKLKFETLLVYVAHLENRPSIPEHWEHIPLGCTLQKLVTGCWDQEPDARFTAQYVLNKLLSLPADSSQSF